MLEGGILLNKNILATGIIVLFVLSALTPIVFGFSIETSRDTILFSQLPFEPQEDFKMYISDVDWELRVHDNYWEVSENISDIHWWGFSLYWNGSGWKACNPVATCFEIIFWDALLGNQICDYQVCPPATPTGKFYDGFEMYKWEAILDSGCPQWPDGWVSIQSIYSPYDCVFIWMGSPDGDLHSYQEGNSSVPNKDTDVAFEFTNASPPAICCKGEIMEWIQVKPGRTVHGTFYVWNCGDNGSLLTWYISSYPPWMNDIVFSHTGGNLTGGDSGQVVHFNFTAPDIEFWEFDGYIIVVNFGDPQDFCKMSVHLITVRSKGVFFNFFKSLINNFPILQRLLLLIK